MPLWDKLRRKEDVSARLAGVGEDDVPMGVPPAPLPPTQPTHPITPADPKRPGAPVLRPEPPFTPPAPAPLPEIRPDTTIASAPPPAPPARLAAPSSPFAPSPLPTYSDPGFDIDDFGVTCRRRAGLVEQVSWAELGEVAIRVSIEDGKPARYWLLGHRAGSGCVVPWDSPAAGALTVRLQALPNFEESKRRSAANARFDTLYVCWRAR